LQERRAVFIQPEVYFIPRMTAKIICVRQLDEVGYDIHIKTGKMDIREPSGRLLARIERKQSRLYVLDVNIVRRAACLSARAEVKVRHWHTRLGHVNMPVLRSMANQDWVRGLPQIGLMSELYDPYMAGK
jgi:hypothetical protein